MDIPREQKFYYLVATVIVLWFFNTAYKPNLAFVVSLVLVALYITYDTTTAIVEDSDENVKLMSQLDGILEERTPPAFFYLEPDFISFFHSIKDFEKYSMDSYFKAVKCTNNMLRFKKELEYDSEYDDPVPLESWKNFGKELPSKRNTVIKNGKANFEQAEIQGFKALGYIRSFEVVLPVNMKTKYEESISRFHILMKRTLDEIRAHYRKTDDTIGINYGLPRAKLELVDVLVPNFKN